MGMGNNGRTATEGDHLPPTYPPIRSRLQAYTPIPARPPAPGVERPGANVAKHAL